MFPVPVELTNWFQVWHSKRKKVLGHHLLLRERGKGCWECTKDIIICNLLSWPCLSRINKAENICKVFALIYYTGTVFSEDALAELFKRKWKKIALRSAILKTTLKKKKNLFEQNSLYFFSSESNLAEQV